jgi:alcohol dehydrogenase class IV
LVHGKSGLTRFDALIREIQPKVLVMISAEPNIQDLETALADAMRADIDSVVSIGGGSVIDMGKAIAGMVANHATQALDHMEVIGLAKPLPIPALPHIAVPTTSGTGSEVTKNAVITSKEHGVKASIRSPTMIPTVALIDPKLTVSCSHLTTAATGLDALTQNLEPYLSPMANPMTDSVALQGMALAGKYLERAYKNGSDLEAREGMALCSVLGGLALANAKLGAVHGCAGVLGGKLASAPHGSLCAALLASTIKVNYSKLTKSPFQHVNPFPSPPTTVEGMSLRYKIAAQTLLGRVDASVEEMIAWIAQLCQTLRVPGLASYGLTEQDIATVTAQSLASSSMKGNSIKLDSFDVEAILKSSM